MKKVTFIDEERKNYYQRNHRNFISINTRILVSIFLRKYKLPQLNQKKREEIRNWRSVKVAIYLLRKAVGPDFLHTGTTNCLCNSCFP